MGNWPQEMHAPPVLCNASIADSNGHISGACDSYIYIQKRQILKQSTIATRLWVNAECIHHFSGDTIDFGYAPRQGLREAVGVAVVGGINNGNAGRCLAYCLAPPLVPGQSNQLYFHASWTSIQGKANNTISYTSNQARKAR